MFPTFESCKMEFVNPACLNIENGATKLGVILPTCNDPLIPQGAILYDLCVSLQDLVIFGRSNSVYPGRVLNCI